MSAGQAQHVGRTNFTGRGHMARKARTWRTMLAALAAGLVLIAAVWAVWAFASPLASASTPDGTVLRYYQLLSRGRLRDAQGLYAPEITAVWNGSLSKVPAIGFTAISPWGIRVDKPGPGAPDESQGHEYTYHYRQFATVGVYFSQWWGDVTTSPGGQFSDVLLGRKGPDSPWVILEEGSGG